MADSAPIPVYLLSGFLGAGKTTLLQRLFAAERAAGRTPAVLMNEFGDLGIDTLLLGPDATVRELLGGCICCSLQNDLLLTLAELIEQHPDSLFIEATGLADPLDILDALTSPELLDQYRLCHVIALVDCGNWGLVAANRELIERQVTFADRILINKTDQADERVIAQIESDLANWSPKAVLIRTSHAQIDTAELLAVSPDPPQLPSTAGLTAITTLGFHTLVQRFDGPIERATFEASLAALPPGVLRAKGFVRFLGDPQTYLVQVVGTYRKLYRFEVPEGTPLEVVYIGPHVGGHEAELRAP